jgi:hypothetical protein
MSPSQLPIDCAIREVEQLRKTLKQKHSLQVGSEEERSLISATAYSWFQNHRVALKSIVDDNLAAIDEMYKELLAASERYSLRSKYAANLKALKESLVDLRSRHAVSLAASASQYTSDQPPAFASLISDASMQQILTRRWQECVTCIGANAPLAAIVMMGGLLEALLLARILREPKKDRVFKASNAPKDKITGKTSPLNEWFLRDYIDVAHEVKRISKSAKDVGTVLRDYRNYIHPHKEASHGVALEQKDAMVLWEVCKSLSKQVLSSVP